MKPQILTVFAIMITLLLTGCGNKAALYLPKADALESTDTLEQTSDETDDDKSNKDKQNKSKASDSALPTTKSTLPTKSEQL